MNDLDSIGRKITHQTDMMNSKKGKFKPQSFRLTPDDETLLLLIRKEVNLLSNKSITKTQIIKGLLRVGRKMKPKLIYKEIKETL